MSKAILAFVVKALIGAYPRWSMPPKVALEHTPQRVYFANHSSHLDAVALWASLPPVLRNQTRPVAALDYWSKGFIRRYIANKILNVVLIDRTRSTDTDPLEPVHEALNNGNSLIIFPEGTRNDDAQMLEFKAGLYHLAKLHPYVELIPVYLDNARRALPKGSLVPIPLTCLVRFGSPIRVEKNEDKQQFLNRARSSVLALKPEVV